MVSTGAGYSLTDCQLSQLVAEVSFVEKDSLLNRLETLWNRNGSITRQEAAILFWILSYSSLTVPSKHILRLVVENPETKAKQWKEVAITLQSSPLTDMTRYEMLLGATLNTLEAMWEAYDSNFEANWQATGAGIRKAAALHLFSRQNRPFLTQEENLTNHVKIDTCKLVQKLQIMDRWIAFADLRPLGIHPSDIEAWQLSDEPLCLRAWIEEIQVKLLESARQFVLRIDSDKNNRQQLYNELDRLLKRVNEDCTTVIARYTDQTSIRFDPTLCIQGDSGPHAAHLVSWLMSCTFIGCMAGMRFTCDESSPLQIRFASL